MQLIQTGQAQTRSTGRGVIIADIDGAIDVSHPALRGPLTTGYDFVGSGAPRTRTGATLDQSTASFLDQSTASFLDQSTASFLDQSTASFLDQSTASFLDQSTASFLDQSTASFLDQSTASFLDSSTAGHGHATMVAGIMVAIAPDALIMPLRAFDDSGAGDAFQVAKAIRYAVRNGAHIINLSLGLSDQSKAVEAAIAFAEAHNVIIVASAGNSDSAAPQYPAVLPGVLGVAASDSGDLKATFSNYGEFVFVTAPGFNIVTAYPGGYAVASGTSFSTAFVSAEAALIRSLTTNGIADVIAGSSVNIDGLNPSYAGQLGSGRIDLYAAVTSRFQATQGPGSRQSDRYIVMFRRGHSKANRAASASRAGASLRFNYDIVDAIAVSVPSQAALALMRQDRDVVEVIPDRPVFLLGGGAGTGGGTVQVTPAGVTKVGVPTTTSNGAGIGVAVLDTGIDFNQTDLAPASQSFSAFGGSCQDDNGHGTHVAGTISALSNTIGVVGVAPQSKPYCVKVLDSTGSGSDSNIIAGLDWIYNTANLVTPTIRVANMSFGRNGTISDNSAYRTAIQRLYSMGIVMVVAAGNDRTREVSQIVPSAYPEVISVASTTAIDGTNACRTYKYKIYADTASYFTTDGRFDSTTGVGVTVSAPGEDKEDLNTLCAAVPLGILSLKLGGGTIRYYGTSMAAPHVAGVVARMMQAGKSGVENVRSQLRATAQKIGTGPLNSIITGYTFDGEREGIAKAP
jgi:subtilisin